MLARPLVTLGGLDAKAEGGIRPLEQLQIAAVTTNGNVSLTTQQIQGGVIARTGPDAAGFTDTLPPVTDILAALPGIGKGDSFTVLIRNTSNQTGTIAAGTGMTLTGTATIATNKAREFMITVNSVKQTVTLVGVTDTVVPKTLSGFTAAEVAQVEPGMAVTGTGIGASAVVTGVNPDLGYIYVSVDSTDIASNIAITFTPAATVQSLRLADV